MSTKLNRTAMAGLKPNRLPLGPVANVADDDRSFTEALIAKAQEIWLTAPDKAEIQEIQHDLRHGFDRLDRLVERALEVLRSYLPEYTVFATTTHDRNIVLSVVPDELNLHRAVHAGTLERGGVIPESRQPKVKYWLSEFESVNQRHTILYKRVGGRATGGTRAWELVWQSSVSL